MPRSFRRLSLAAIFLLYFSHNAFGQSYDFRLKPASVKRAGPGDPNCAKPEYPKDSLRNEEQGRVTISFLIDAEGAILDSKIVRSSGFPRLDDAALQALAKCQFKLSVGDTGPSWMAVTYEWFIR